MAGFKKGKSYDDQRVFVSSIFPQGGKNTGYNVALSIANDLETDTANMQTAPMLVYDSFMHKGEKKPSYVASYSAEQWDKIQKISNKDGDKMVFLADLIPNNGGPGLVVNTNKLKAVEHPFSIDKHRENTLSARNATKSVEDAVSKSAENDSERAAEH